MADLDGEIRGFWRSTPRNKRAVEDYLAQNHDGAPVRLFLESATAEQKRALIGALAIHSDHVIILIHGMGTRAFWYEVAKPVLSSVENITVKPIGYGYFNPVKFLMPWLTRKAPANRLATAIRSVKWELGSETRISIIAHSFGSYTALSVLEDNSDIEFYNLILCGSIVPQRYNFGRIKRQVQNKLVNDVGRRDIYPVLAKIFSYGFGESGTFGFYSEFCEDRMHNFRHSDFFSETFIKEFWCPIFSNNQLVPSRDSEPRDGLTRAVRYLSMLPAASVPVVLLVLALLVFAPRAYVGCGYWPGAPWCVAQAAGRNDDSAVARIRNFIVADEANRRLVQQYLRQNGIDEPIAVFLRSAEAAAVRSRMIRDLGIP